MNTRIATAVGSAALAVLLGACTGTTDTDQPTVTVTQEAAPAPVESSPREYSPRESSSSDGLSRETELAILKVAFDRTLDSMSYSEMAEICALWTGGDALQALALETVVEGFASVSTNQHLTDRDIRRVARDGFDDYCGG